jgi:hypothetical protein
MKRRKFLGMTAMTLACEPLQAAALKEPTMPLPKFPDANSVGWLINFPLWRNRKPDSADNFTLVRRPCFKFAFLSTYLSDVCPGSRGNRESLRPCLSQASG